MRQITVLLDNHTGALADVTLALAERRINIDAIVCDAVEAHGVIRLSVDRYDDALVALRDAGFQAISEEALVLRLPDEPGALAKVAVLLKNAGIVVQSMRILKRDGSVTLVTLVTDAPDRAAEVTRDYLLPSESLPGGSP